MSDAVELRVYELLGKPSRSPYGNPIPGLALIDPTDDCASASSEGERNLAAPGLVGEMVVRRITESVQTDIGMLRRLHEAGVDPGATITVAQDRDDVIIDRSGERMRLSRDLASRVFVVGAASLGAA